MTKLQVFCILLGFLATYKETSTTAVSANPAVAVPLLTINGWILMHRQVTGGSLSFNQNWAAYRDGFGSATGNDNYWLGLDKVYSLMQLGSTTLRVEVYIYTRNSADAVKPHDVFTGHSRSPTWYHSVCSVRFSISVL